jgi:hypothetical protein
VAAFEGFVEDCHECLVGLQERVADLELRVRNIRQHPCLRELEASVRDLAIDVYLLRRHGTSRGGSRRPAVLYSIQNDQKPPSG